MLYPEFDELVSYKNLKLDIAHSSYHISKSQTLGGQRSPFRGQGLEFHAVREYVPGDDIRNIDWKVTARTSFPHLKIFQEARQRHTYLCIDVNASMRFGTRGTFKSVQAARIASLLGWQGIAQKDRVSACLFGDVPGGIELFTSKHNRKSFLQLLNRLSQASSEQHYVSFLEAVDLITEIAYTGSLVYLISDFMDITAENQHDILFSRLNQKCDLVLISVNDPADKALVPLGRLDVCSIGHEKFAVNTDSVAGRKAYALQWEENRKNLYQKATECKIPLIELTTETDIKKDLWLALKSLSKRRRR